jgi:transposase
VLDWVDRRLRKLQLGARVRIAREQLAQIRRLNHSINQLRSELAELVTAHRPKLLAEQGCGVLTAAIMIGHTAGNERFRSDASFALQTGTAPIPCSSGQRTQHRLGRGGDRQLGHALHIIAVTRAQRDLTTKEYLARKAAESKTTRGALRCLKRHLARRFYRLLAEPRADQQHAVESQAIIEPQATASNGKPTTIPKTARTSSRHDPGRRRPPHLPCLSRS